MNRIWRSRLTVLLPGLTFLSASFLIVAFEDSYITNDLRLNFLVSLFFVFFFGGIGCIWINFLIVAFETFGPEKMTKEEKYEEIVEDLNQIETLLTQEILSKDLSVIRNDLRIIEVDSKISAVRNSVIDSTLVKLYDTIENFNSPKIHQ